MGNNIIRPALRGACYNVQPGALAGYKPPEFENDAGYSSGSDASGFMQSEQNLSQAVEQAVRWIKDKVSVSSHPSPATATPASTPPAGAKQTSLQH